MLKFYHCYATTYCDNKEIATRYGGTYLVEEGSKENHTETLTWENLQEKYRENGLDYYFNIWNLRKGRVISFFNMKHKDIKEWKEKNLNISIKYEFRENTNVSLDDVLKWHDIDRAIQYLNERGLSIH